LLIHLGCAVISDLSSTVIRTLALTVLYAVLAGAQTPGPKCLLVNAKQQLPRNDSVLEIIDLLRAANAEFANAASDDPAHAESLNMLALFLRGSDKNDPERWKSEVSPLVEDALRICEKHPDLDSAILALALEIKADLLGRTGAGAPIWLRAQRIRAARIAAVRPERSQTLLALSSNSKGHAIPPTIDVKLEPAYPDAARHAGLECSGIMIAIIIDTTGLPGEFRLLHGCGYGFDEEAVEAVKRWRFHPSTLDGSPVSVPANVEVNFKLLSPDAVSARPPKGAEKSIQQFRNQSPQMAAPASPNGDITKAAELVRTGYEALNWRDYAAAQRQFEEAIQLDPANLYAWNDLGLAYLGMHQLEKAEAAFKRQIEMNPLDPWAYNNLGRVFVIRGDVAEAIAEFRKQLEISPRDSFAHITLAGALQMKGEWEEALKKAAKATEITPGNPLCWVLLGRAQARSGKLDEARRSLDRALESGDNTTVQNAIAYELADAGIDLEKAWQLASGALAVHSSMVCNPDRIFEDEKCTEKLSRLANVLDTAGWILFKQGKLQDAKAYLTSSYGISPQADVAIHMAALDTQLGDISEATRMYGTARLAPDFIEVDAVEIRKNLASHASGDPDLESRLRSMPKDSLVPGFVHSTSIKSSTLREMGSMTISLLALVDSNGEVKDIKVKSGVTLTPEQLAAIRKLKLLPLSWPGHALQSLRTIEIHSTEDGLRVVSYVKPPAH
jgi:TonB family protein